MNNICLGRCSICGGKVSMYTGTWWGTTPPPKACESCGATASDCLDRIIPMEPVKKQEIKTQVEQFLEFQNSLKEEG